MTSRSSNTDPVIWLREHPLALCGLGFVAMLFMDVAFPWLIYILRPQ